MKVLYPQAWTEPEAPAKPTIDPAEIRAFIETKINQVGKPMPYRVVCDYVQDKLVARNEHYLDSDIYAIIDAIQTEWHPVVEDVE